MIRCLNVLLTASCLAGCTAWPVGSPGSSPTTRQDAWPDLAGGAYDFAWHLSGDRAVAPLQVFDDGRHTWLQFHAGQPLPALFGARDGAQQLLRYRHLPPYVQVEGVWQTLVMRGGALSATAQYQGNHQQGRSALASASHASQTVQAMPLVSSPHTTVADAAEPAFVALPSAPPPTETNAQPSFRATPADVNIRRALARWAKTAQWSFEPEHWTLDVDIPLAGSADFPADFKQAVQQLLAATELSERPLQPCFYSNKVLRVVPLAQACDRTARHTGAAS